MADKETKELLIGVNQLSIDLIKLIKKHLGVVDLASALLGDADLRVAITNAIEGISGMPSEIASMSGADYLDLAQAQISFIPDIISALNS